MDLEKLKYPIGRFNMPDHFDNKLRHECIQNINELPSVLENVTSDLTDLQLDTPYRPEGWTVRQLVHHIADSHINSYVRFKWTLTEDEPTIKAYDEKLWAELPDAKSESIILSIRLLKSLHARWVAVLKQMKPNEFEKKLTHPESGKKLSLNWMVALYSWHGEHHVAHITELIKRKSW